MLKAIRSVVYFILLTISIGLFSGCTGFGAVPTPTVALLGIQKIIVESPPANSTISSPVLVRATLTQLPVGSAINYRVFDSRNALVGSGVLAVQPEAPTRFSGQVTFATTQAGPGRLELFEFVASENIIRGGVIVPITLTAAGLVNVSPVPGMATPLPGMATPLPGMATPLPGMVIPQPTQPAPTGQSILIETPAPATQVGSPVVLTGRTLRLPAQGLLRYRVMDANERQIGGGVIPVAMAADGIARFNASLLFTEPAGGGAIRIDLADQADGAATPTAIASIALRVAVAGAGPTPGAGQQISFLSPAPNTAVTSPVVITGRTTRMPFQNNLSYTIRDSSGRMLASGLIGVDGNPPSFNVAMPFEALAPGTTLSIELLDQDADTGNVVGRASLILFYANLPAPVPATVLPTAAIPGATALPIPATTLPFGQLITIDTPAANTIVGSPVTITGRVAVPATNGRLFYRIMDANNTVLGENNFPVGSSGQVLAFNAVLSFNLPQRAGPIIIELTDREANNAIRARAILLVQVGSAYPGP